MSNYDLIITRNGEGPLLSVHSSNRCKGRACCIHNPSDHHMKEWPQEWRGDRGLMERVCSHNVGHPDPDDLQILLKVDGADVHGCDGCCRDPRGTVSISSEE